MTHEETSLQTKKALCASLKELMRKKAFSKITISELIDDCNLSRKTFYYHFEDIYGLLKWMLEQETFEVVKQFDLLVDYKDAYDFVIDYVEKNSYVLNCIYDSIGREQLKRFLYQDFIGLTEKLIRQVEAAMNITVSDHFRSFLCHFYTEGIAGMLIDLFQNPEMQDKEETLTYLSVILHKSLPAILSSENEP